MACQFFRGKYLADRMLNNIKQEVFKRQVRPKLLAILVGEDPASQVYVRHKENACNHVGIASEIIRVPETHSTAMVSEILVDAGEREDVDGILLQLPVPDHLDERFLCNLIPPTKDVDAHNAASIGNLVYGRGIFVPPTASAVAHCIQENGIDTFGKRVLVVGRSRHCGLPITLIMQGFRTHPELPDVADLYNIAASSDIIISAAGVPGLIRPQMIKDGAILIDIGFSRKISGSSVGKVRLMGDIHPDCRARASFITPVPGGIGPLTVAHLVRNTLNAHLHANGLPRVSLLIKIYSC
ncbi:unnamed protein product, partial [Oikopleura dioica]